MSTTACHLSLSWARWIQSTPSHSTAPDFQTISLPSHACNVSCPPNSSWCDHPNNIWHELQKMEHLIMEFSPASWYLPPHNQNLQHQHHEQLGFRSNKACTLDLEYVQRWQMVFFYSSHISCISFGTELQLCWILATFTLSFMFICLSCIVKFNAVHPLYRELHK